MNCDMEAVEDITHLVVHCPKYSDIRKDFYEKVLNNVAFNTLCDIDYSS